MEFEQLELPFDEPKEGLFEGLESDLKIMHSKLLELDDVFDQIFDRLGVSCEELGRKPEPKPKKDKEVDWTLEEVLVKAICDHKHIKLEVPKLTRESWVRADKLLRLLGGKWQGGKTQAHVFKENPKPLLQRYLEFGELPDLNPLAFFATKPNIAQMLVNWIRPENSGLMLDADAGLGAFAIAFKKKFPESTIHMIECDPGRAEALRQLKLGEVFEENFLAYPTTGYNAILINPPFSVKEDKKAYILHIYKTWECLAKGGQLAAIAPLGFTFSKDRKSSEFLAFVEQHGYYEELPPKSFEGTDVIAAAIYLEK